MWPSGLLWPSCHPCPISVQRAAPACAVSLLSALLPALLSPLLRWSSSEPLLPFASVAQPATPAGPCSLLPDPVPPQCPWIKSSLQPFLTPCLMGLYPALLTLFLRLSVPPRPLLPLPVAALLALSAASLREACSQRSQPLWPWLSPQQPIPRTTPRSLLPPGRAPPRFSLGLLPSNHNPSCYFSCVTLTRPAANPALSSRLPFPPPISAPASFVCPLGSLDPALAALSSSFSMPLTSGPPQLRRLWSR